jgi:hypothetical protein
LRGTDLVMKNLHATKHKIQHAAPDVFCRHNSDVTCASSQARDRVSVSYSNKNPAGTFTSCGWLWIFSS